MSRSGTIYWPNPKLRCHPIFALDSEHILLEELFKTKTSSLDPWLHPSTKWFWFSSKWQGEVIKNFGFQLWDPHQMNSVRGYIHDRYATLGVCDLRFLRYVLLNSSKEMEDNMSIDEDSTNRNVPKNPPLLCLQPHSPPPPDPLPTTETHQQPPPTHPTPPPT